MCDSGCSCCTAGLRVRVTGSAGLVLASRRGLPPAAQFVEIPGRVALRSVNNARQMLSWSVSCLPSLIPEQAL